MTTVLQTLGLLLLLPLAALGPGVAVVGRLRWEPLEKFVAGTGLSFVTVYLCGFALFAAAAPRWAYWAVMAAMTLVALTQLRSLRRLWLAAAVRAAVVGYGVLCAWLFLLLCLARHFAGGIWAGDWAEHYQRTQVFLRLIPIDTRFLGLFTLPARPPMMNVVAAFFCRLSGTRDGQLQFTAFSLVFLLLNAWAFLPAMLLYRRFLAARRRRLNLRSTALLATLLALNPFFDQNATWTWTKLLCAGYVLLGIHFYLRSWTAGIERDSTGIHSRCGSYLLASFVSLSAALMVHFTAWPYVALIGLHAIWIRRRDQRGRRGELLAAISAGAVVAAPWFGWSIGHFGVGGTFGAYFAAPPGALEVAVPLWARPLLNLLYSFVPQPPVRSQLLAWFAGDSNLNLLRDYWFELSQSNLLMMAGCVGGPIVLVLTLRRLRGRRNDRSPILTQQLRLWRWLVVGGALLGVLSTARAEPFGAGMLCQPLVVMALVFLAAELPSLPAVLRAAAVVGCAIDFALGIALHFWMLHAVFVATAAPGGVLVQHDGFSVMEAQNWWSKQTLHLVFWGDYAAPAARLLLVLVVAGGISAVGGLVWLLWRGADRSAWASVRRAGSARHAAAP